MMDDNSMTVRDAGKLGGKKRAETADFRAMGQAGGAVTLSRHGKAHYAAIGKKGGTALARTHGREYFEQMGKKGGQRTADLCRKGRATEPVTSDESKVTSKVNGGLCRDSSLVTHHSSLRGGTTR